MLALKHTYRSIKTHRSNFMWHIVYGSWHCIILDRYSEDMFHLSGRVGPMGVRPPRPSM